MTSFRCRLGLLVTIAGVCSACTLAPTPPEDWRLESGLRLTAMSGTSEPVVAIVLDPTECFSCISTVAEWLEWSRTGEGKLLLIFSRRPTEAEHRILLTSGVRSDG